MQKYYSIKKRYKLLLPLMFVAWLMMMVQALPHHHHSDERICLEGPEAHCTSGCQSGLSTHHCDDELKPCNKHIDIEKPRLEQHEFKAPRQLIAIIQSLASVLLATPELARGRARAPTHQELSSQSHGKTFALRAPPFFL